MMYVPLGLEVLDKDEVVGNSVTDVEDIQTDEVVGKLNARVDPDTEDIESSILDVTMVASLVVLFSMLTLIINPLLTIQSLSESGLFVDLDRVVTLGKLRYSEGLCW